MLKDEVKKKSDYNEVKSESYCVILKLGDRCERLKINSENVNYDF